MGLFSSISSALGAHSEDTQSIKSPEAMRKKHGFKDFSAEMKRMQNYDPEKETLKEETADSDSCVSTRQPGKKK